MHFGSRGVQWLFISLSGLLAASCIAWLLFSCGSSSSSSRSTAAPDKVYVLPIRAKYFTYVKRNPELGKNSRDGVADLKRRFNNQAPDHWDDLILVIARLHLDRRISVNSAMHGLMAFGPDLPVLVDVQPVGVLDFLQHYFDYIPAALREDSPPWITQLPHGHFAVTSYAPRIVSDHLGQFVAYCAIADVAPITQFTMKTGESVSLQTLIDSDLRAADPSLHDPTWQTVTAAKYRPIARWQNAEGKWLTSFDFLEKTVNLVPGHNICGHAHPLISTAYAVEQYKKYAGLSETQAHLRTACLELERWAKIVKETVLEDGCVSRTWYLSQKAPPESIQEMLTLNGHTLEWLVIALDDREIGDEWVRSIASRWADGVLESLDSSGRSGILNVDYASLCHGARGLRRYVERTRKHGVSSERS